jgi:serine/threonine-protein kinase
MPKSLFGYEVVQRLGEGALSTIYVVDDPKTRQLFAMKHVVPSDEKHRRFIEQLEVEFKIARTFRHPGLRRCLDLKYKKRFFGGGILEAGLLMELVDGVCLDQELPQGVPAIADVFIKVGEALAGLHHYQYLHCDTKPSNIIRDGKGNVKLIDFGQACPAGTTKQRVQGTPDFIAPEQARCKQLNYFTDVYNYGATMYWALTGRKVPTILTVPKEHREILKEQNYPEPHEINPAVPEDLSELIMECVQMAPAYRPQTVDEVLKRLAVHGTGTVK